MKKYKISFYDYTKNIRSVILKAVQQHSFALGYKWPDGDKKVQEVNKPYLFFDSNGCITFSDDLELESNYFELISPENFLDLTKEETSSNYLIFEKGKFYENKDSKIILCTETSNTDNIFSGVEMYPFEVRGTYSKTWNKSKFTELKGTLTLAIKNV